MKRMIKFFQDMKFRYKLMVTYVLLGILPIIILGCIWYGQSRNMLIDKERNNIQNYLKQAVSNMDNQLRIYDNLSDYVAFNQQIIHVVTHDYNSYYEMYDQFTNVLDPMLNSMKYFHNDVDKVTIYTENDIVKHSTTIAPIDDIKNQWWYSDKIPQNTQSQWFVSKNDRKIFSVRGIPTADKSIDAGLLYLEVSYDKLFESFCEMNDENYGIFIEDKNGNEIFEFSQFKKQNESMKITFDDLKKIKKDKNSKYTIVESSSDNKDWKITLYKPDKLIFDTINNMAVGTIIIVVLFVILSFMITSIVSKVMVSGLEKLRADMEKVENGNMEITVKSDGKDEIGALIRGFRKMIFEIKSLIQDVYESRIKQKEYEMRALQAQINPHFLYNTLSLINWMALESNQKDISKITLSLSTFYRTALNKGKNILSVRDEIKNMQSYLDIQLMMHDYEFETEVDIDECIMKYRILNLLLQPLIENAIDHGIDLKTSGKGKITIIGRQEENNIVLKVIDNGIGMDKETSESILTNQSKGYGVRNVNERIKLYYGEEYAIHIESEVGKGTCITVTIPIKNY